MVYFTKSKPLNSTILGQYLEKGNNNKNRLSYIGACCLSSVKALQSIVTLKVLSIFFLYKGRSPRFAVFSVISDWQKKYGTSQIVYKKIYYFQGKSDVSTMSKSSISWKRILAMDFQNGALEVLPFLILCFVAEMKNFSPMNSLIFTVMKFKIIF